MSKSPKTGDRVRLTQTPGHDGGTGFLAYGVVKKVENDGTLSILFDHGGRGWYAPDDDGLEVVG